MDELLHFQTIGLNSLVSHAYNTVPFYKKLFDNNKVHPNDIKTIEDISKLPIIDKQILKQNSFSDLISKDYKNKKLIPITTSGSSGMMLKFFIDNSFDQFRKAQFLRPYITNGKSLFDKTVIFTAPKLTTKKWFQHFGLLNGKKVFYNTNTEEQIRVIQKHRPSVIQGCASVLNLLAINIIDNKIEIPKPRLMFSDSEVLTPSRRENIKRGFETDVIDIYGTYETDNIAYECKYHRGYHIAIDSVIMELIRNGKKAEPGKEGEVVVTVLNNFAMPFIRYNLHDISSYSTQSCSCGRTFPLLNKIQGRSDDYMITAEGKRLSFVTLGAYWHPLTKFVDEYQLIQEDVNSFTIFIVPNKSFNDECRNIIASEITKYFPHANIDIKLVPFIKREESGKLLTFKSNIKWSHPSI